jgi:hypothetical protein
MAGNGNSGDRPRNEKDRLARKQQEWREKIQVGAILNVLMDHAVKGKEIAPSRIKAAEILLSKTLPNLTNATLDLQGNPLAMLYDRATEDEQPATNGTTNGHAGNGASH